MSDVDFATRARELQRDAHRILKAFPDPKKLKAVELTCPPLNFHPDQERWFDLVAFRGMLEKAKADRIDRCDVERSTRLFADAYCC